MERTVTQERTPSPTIQLIPPLLPPTLSQHQRRSDQQTRASGTSRGVPPPAQLAPGSIQGSRGAFRGGHRARALTPAPHQGPSTSHFALQVGGGTSSVGPTSSAFSFRVPNQASHQVYGIPRNDYNLHPTSAGHHSDGHNSTASTQNSAQASVRTSAVLARPSTWNSNVDDHTSHQHPGRSIIGNSLSSENLMKYADILRESEKEWEGTVHFYLGV